MIRDEGCVVISQVEICRAGAINHFGCRRFVGVPCNAGIQSLGSDAQVRNHRTLSINCRRDRLIEWRVDGRNRITMSCLKCAITRVDRPGDQRHRAGKHPGVDSRFEQHHVF